jgi:hypothetical protein
MVGKIKKATFGVQQVLRGPAQERMEALTGMYSRPEVVIEIGGHNNEQGVFVMLLLIPEPTSFYSESDEDYFFDWLKSIPAIKDVVGVRGGLNLTIEDPIDQLSFYELIGLLTRYQLDKKVLRRLCELHDDP